MADKNTDDQNPRPFTSGLQANGEFNVGEKITFAVRDNKILLRRKPQGDEVEVAEATLAGLLIDEYFTDKENTDKTKRR